ncbi:NAD-dependent epimerase/dehydratase family protein [archaeon]|nr:MAG: NAD-dependent epimerase/dehydratase family protein [archaeon]
MKVAIFGATGKSGSRIQAELLSRGHEVIAIARDPSKMKPAERLTVRQGEADGDLAQLIEGADVVVNAYAPPWEHVQALVTFTQRLVDAVKQTGVKRLLMVGGAGGLKQHAGTEERVIDAPWFPEEWKPIAQAHIDALQVLRGSDINWTTLTPPGYFEPGERTGKFRLDTDTMVATEAGARISMEDYAIALADEIERSQYERQRFTVGY